MLRIPGAGRCLLERETDQRSVVALVQYLSGRVEEKLGLRSSEMSTRPRCNGRGQSDIGRCAKAVRWGRIHTPVSISTHRSSSTHSTDLPKVAKNVKLPALDVIEQDEEGIGGLRKLPILRFSENGFSLDLVPLFDSRMGNSSPLFLFSEATVPFARRLSSSLLVVTIRQSKPRASGGQKATSL
jgi:hypothetical protein